MFRPRGRSFEIEQEAQAHPASARLASARPQEDEDGQIDLAMSASMQEEEVQDPEEKSEEKPKETASQMQAASQESEVKEEKELLVDGSNENDQFWNGVYTPANIEELATQLEKFISSLLQGGANTYFDFQKLASVDFPKVRDLLEAKYQEWMVILNDPGTIDKMDPSNERFREELTERLNAGKNKGFPLTLAINSKQSAEHINFIYELLKTKLVGGFKIQEVNAHVDVNKLIDCFINNSFLITANFGGGFGFGEEGVKLNFQQANKLLVFVKQGPVLPITVSFDGSNLTVDPLALTYEDRLKFDLIKDFAKLAIWRNEDVRTLDIQIGSNPLFYYRIGVEELFKQFFSFESWELKAKDSAFKELNFEGLKDFQADDLQELADYIIALNKPENPGVKIILDFKVTKCDSEMWYQFLEKICKHGKIISFQIDGNPQESLPLNIIFQNLKQNKALKTLDLCGLNLKEGEPNEEHKEDEHNESEYIVSLQHLISTAENNLEQVYLTRCILDSASNNKIDNALRVGRKKLIDLRINNCQSQVDEEMLSFSPNAVYSILKENMIKKLYLDNFLVPGEDPERLEEALAENTSLEELFIGSVEALNESIQAILANHSNLTSLRVSGLGRNGALALLKGIYANTKLLDIIFDPGFGHQVWSYNFLDDEEFTNLRSEILNRNKALVKQDFVGTAIALYQGARQGIPWLSADVASKVCSFFVPTGKAHYAKPAEVSIAARCGFLADVPKSKEVDQAQVVPEEKGEGSINSRTLNPGRTT